MPREYKTYTEPLENKSANVTYTVVYLVSNKQPRETRAVEIVATSARDALQHFINLKGMENMFVACIVKGVRDIVSFTK